MRKARGILVTVLVLSFQVAMAQSPTPSPSPNPGVSKDELKKSAEKFSEELKKTKDEVGAALDEDKKPKPEPAATPQPQPPQVTRRKPPRRSVKSTPVEIKRPTDSVVTEQTIPGTTVTPKPTTPLQSADASVETPVKAINKVKRRRTFWQKVWHVLPFRFFGEH